MELKSITSLESLGKGRRPEIAAAVEALEDFQPARAVELLEGAAFPNTADRQAQALLLATGLACRNRPMAAIKALSKSRDWARVDSDLMLARRILAADLRVETGRASEVTKEIEACRALARKNGLEPLYVEATIVEGAALSARGFQANAMRALEEAAHRARECRAMHLATLAMARLSACHYRAGEVREAMTAAAGAMQVAPAPQGIGYGIAQRHMALTMGVQGDHSAAIEWHRRARTTFAACGYLPGEIRNHLSVGLTYINMGDLVVAGHYLKRAEELNQGGDNPALGTIVQSRLGTLALSKADPERAIEHFQRDADAAGKLDDASGKGYAARNLARAHKAEGRFGEAVGRFLQAAAAFGNAGDPVNLWQTAFELDQVFPLLPDEARRPLADRVRALPRPNDGELLRSPYLLARRCVARAVEQACADEWDKAVAHVDEGVSAFESAARIIQAAEALHFLGRAARQLGQQIVAVSLLQRAFRMADIHGLQDLGRVVLADLADTEAGEAAAGDYLAGREARRRLAKRSGAGGEFSVSPRSPIGGSPAWLKTLAAADELAELDVPVVILGESGSGKELIARRLHDRSLRSGKNFIPVNCAAIPHDIMESALFGHEEGAFTGAVARRPGCIEAADGGTLFLDEVGEIPLSSQPKLLRFLDDGEILPVGSTTVRRPDVRVICATNRDLRADVKNKKLRQDLYYRIAVTWIVVPPLRERGDDVIEIAKRILAESRLSQAHEVSGLTPAARRRLLKHTWPNNVRELVNVMTRAIIRVRRRAIDASDLIFDFDEPVPKAGRRGARK